MNIYEWFSVDDVSYFKGLQGPMMVLKFQLFQSITLNKAAEKYGIILVCQIRYLEHHGISRRQRLLGARVGDSNWFSGGSQLSLCLVLLWIIGRLAALYENQSQQTRYYAHAGYYLTQFLLSWVMPTVSCRLSCSVVPPAGSLSGGIQPKVRGLGFKELQLKHVDGYCAFTYPIFIPLSSQLSTPN